MPAPRTCPPPRSPRAWRRRVAAPAAPRDAPAEPAPRSVPVRSPPPGRSRRRPAVDGSAVELPPEPEPEPSPSPSRSRSRSRSPSPSPSRRLSPRRSAAPTARGGARPPSSAWSTSSSAHPPGSPPPPSPDRRSRRARRAQRPEILAGAAFAGGLARRPDPQAPWHLSRPPPEPRRSASRRSPSAPRCSCARRSSSPRPRSPRRSPSSSRAWWWAWRRASSPWSASLFLLHGLAWLAWFALRSPTTVFWGFFVVAGVLFLLGGLAGFLAARFVKAGASPTPDMAIDEAQRIKQTVQEASPEAMPAQRTPAERDPGLDRGQPPRAGRRRSSSCAARSRVLTDWRRHLVAHQKQVLIGAAVAGFVVGGGIAAVGGLLRRRR